MFSALLHRARSTRRHTGSSGVARADATLVGLSGGYSMAGVANFKKIFLFLTFL